MYFCMNIMMIGAQINWYFEEKFKWVHQVATETLKREYQQLIGRDDEEDDEDDGVDEEGMGDFSKKSEEKETKADKPSWQNAN